MKLESGFADEEAFVRVNQEIMSFKRFKFLFQITIMTRWVLLNTILNMENKTEQDDFRA